jgi:hypothetical protein
MLGFNITFLLIFNSILTEEKEKLEKLFTLFPIGHLLKTDNETWFVILHIDYNKEFRRKLDQFLKIHQLKPKINQIINLFEFNRSHLFWNE